MASATIDVVPYNGALLAVDLLTGTPTLVLGSFGATESGELDDADGTLGTSDNGIATFDSQSITYIGSGTATPGVSVPLVGIVPLGTPVDVVIFEAGGQIYFHYPDGPPDLLSAVAVVIDIDTTPYPIFTPVCFAAGTLMRVPGGQVPVESIAPGDMVEDIFGKSHRVLWTSQRSVDLDRMGLAARKKLAPVRVRAEAFGPGCPARDVWLSQNHLVRMTSSLASLMFDFDVVLAPAKALNHCFGDIDLERPSVTYVHVLCEDHVILSADGLPAESLYLGTQALRALTPVQKAALDRLDPVTLSKARKMTHAAPVLTTREAQLLASEMVRLAA